MMQDKLETKDEREANEKRDKLGLRPRVLTPHAQGKDASHIIN